MYLSVESHLTSQMSNRAIKEHAYLVAYECQNICGDLPEMTAFKSYATKHEQKCQYDNLLAYPQSVFSTECTAKHQVTQGLSKTFSLDQNDAY